MSESKAVVLQEVDQIKESGDTAAPFVSLNKDITSRYIIGGAISVGTYELVAGNEVFANSLPLYALMASAAVASVVVMRNNRERRRVQAADEKQAEIRSALAEPVDLFVQRHKKKTRTVLRWYGDQINFMGAYSRYEITDRLDKLAAFADANGIDEVAISTDTVVYSSDYNGFLKKGRRLDDQDLTNTKLRAIRDIESDNDLIAFTPAQLAELTESIVLPEHKLRKPLTRFDFIVKELQEHAPNHKLISLYEGWQKSGRKSEALDAIKAQLKSAIEARYDDTEGSSNRVLVNGSKRRTKLHKTAQLAGEYISIFATEDGAIGEQKSLPEKRLLVDRLGFSSTEKLWEYFAGGNIPQDELADLADALTWLLIYREEHNKTHKVARKPADVISRGVLAPQATYFERLAHSKGRPSRIEGIKRSPEKRWKLKVSALGMAAASFLIAGSPHVADTANDQREELRHSSHAASRQSAEILNGIHSSDAEMGDASRELWDAGFSKAKSIISAARNFGDDKNGPGDPNAPGSQYDAEQGIPGHALSNIGNAPQGENKAQTVWKIDMQTGAKLQTDGFWTAALQPYVDVNTGYRAGSLPPYRNASLQFREIPLNVNGEIAGQNINLMSSEAVAKSDNHLQISGNQPLSNLNYHTGKVEDVALLRIPVKNGTSLDAAEVEQYEVGTGNFLGKIPTKALRHDDGTYQLVLPNPDKGSLHSGSYYDVDGYLKVKYWLNTKPKVVTNPKAVTPMTDSSTSRPLNEIMDDKDRGNITKALGLPPLTRPYTPQEVAMQIQKTKSYSLTPYRQKGQRYRTGRSASNLDIGEIYSGFGEHAAKLPTQVCNTATMIGILATSGGKVNFVNVGNGFMNNKDSALVTGELHSYMVDNTGKIIDATPAGYIQPAKKTADEPSSISESLQQLREKAKVPAMAIGGMVLLGLGLAGVRRVAPPAARKLRSTPSAIAESQRQRWRNPSNPDKLAERHYLLDVLSAIVYDVASKAIPDYNPDANAHKLSLERRYRNLGNLTVDQLRTLLDARRAHGWEFDAATERDLAELVKQLQQQRELA